MIFASTKLMSDPTWPWSLPGVGSPGLVLVALVLAGLTVLTYLGARGGFRRVLLVLTLRLGALIVACLLMLRPSLAFEDEERFLPSRLLVLIDKSESMNINDSFNDMSRWETVQRLLRADRVDKALKELADQRVEVVYYQGAEDISKYDADGKADGKRTEMGQWLHALWAIHAKDKNLRGLVLLGDGADNGTRFPTLEKAALWRGNCPIYTFGLGQPTTPANLRDIAFDMNRIYADPNPVYVKGKLTIKAFLNAPGFENSKVKLRMFIDDKLAAPVQWVTLPKTQDNEVHVTCDAPIKAGEIKVTLKVDHLPGEVTDSNNEVSTYVSVIKEGVSVLWVEGKKRLESTFAIRYALSPDKRFRVYYSERLKEAKPAPEQEDWFNFDKQHYDVIVIGDITAERFSGGNKNVFSKIKELVEKKGTGLLMLGGYETLGNDWRLPEAADLVALLPVELSDQGQFEGPVKVEPTGKEYILQLSPNETENKDLWKNQLVPLDGMTFLGKPKTIATRVMATREDKEPILVGRDVENGRTLVFGGDTTWKAWRRSKEAIIAYQIFWKQVILWLAHQEQAEGNVRVIPDTRRLAAGGNRLGFTVQLHGKGGAKVDNARFQVKVIGPNKEESQVSTAQEEGKERGYFWKAHAPGEYRIVATAIGSKEKPGEAKFLAYPEDVENMRRAADHDFLRKLAQAGGGKFYQADEQKLVQFLEGLAKQKIESTKPKAEVWPDWRRNPASDSLGDQLETLWNSTALLCFMVFTSFLCLEWFLRRRWGMV